MTLLFQAQTPVICSLLLNPGHHSMGKLGKTDFISKFITITVLCNLLRFLQIVFLISSQNRECEVLICTKNLCFDKT